MPPTLFSADMEINLMKFYEQVWVRASGSTLKASEKYSLVAEKLNVTGKVEGWREVTGNKVATKIDTLRVSNALYYSSRFRQKRRTCCIQETGQEQHPSSSSLKYNFKPRA